MFRNSLLIVALLAGPVLAQGSKVQVVNPRGQNLRTDATQSGNWAIGGQSPDNIFTDNRASGLHTLNSSTIPLAALATTTGTFFDISQYSGATISVIADASGTLKIDSSFDGINTDFTSEFSVSSGLPFFVGATPASKFIRVRYTNDILAQNTFALAFIPKTVVINPRFKPLDAVITESSPAQTVRSIIFGKDETTGNFGAVGIEADRLRTVAKLPSPPPGTTSIKEQITGTQSGATDELFIVPSGSTLTFQRLSGGAEVSNSGGKVELFFDVLCDNLNLQFVEVIYANGSSENFLVGDEFVGDGVDCVRLRRTNNGGGVLDMFARWVGYTTP